MVLPRLVKKIIGKYCYIKEGERKIHTLEIGGHVQMAKSDPEAQRKSSLLDSTWFENEYGSLNLETLKFLMHFRESRSSLILFLHILIFFFSFSHTYIFFLFFFILIFFSFSFS
jgi:hypothetical protein